MALACVAASALAGSGTGTGGTGPVRRYRAASCSRPELRGTAEGVPDTTSASTPGSPGIGVAVRDGGELPVRRADRSHRPAWRSSSRTAIQPRRVGTDNRIGASVRLGRSTWLVRPALRAGIEYGSEDYVGPTTGATLDRRTALQGALHPPGPGVRQHSLYALPDGRIHLDLNVRRAAEAAVSSWRRCGGVVVSTDSRPSQDAESTKAKRLRVRARGRRG